MVIPICDRDDSMFSLNRMPGKLSKKYLDKFPEDRSTEDVRHPAARKMFSLRGKDSTEDHRHSTGRDKEKVMSG